MGSAGGARNSLVYNENAFLLSARSMVHCIRSPPADFRPLMQVLRLHQLCSRKTLEVWVSFTNGRVGAVVEQCLPTSGCGSKHCPLSWTRQQRVVAFRFGVRITCNTCDG